LETIHNSNFRYYSFFNLKQVVLQNILSLGISVDMQPEEKIRIRNLNLSCIISLLVTTTYLVVAWDSPAYRVNIFLIMFCVIIGWLSSYLGFFSFAKHFIFFSTCFVLTSLSICFGAGLGVEYYFIILFISVMSHLSQAHLLSIWAAVPVSGFILSKFSHLYFGAFFEGPVLMPYMYVANVIFPFIISYVILRDYLREHSHYRQELVENNLILEKQKTELLESNEIKNKLFSILAHDLRAPFKSVSGFLTLLEGDYLTGEERDKFLKKLNAQLNSSSDMLDNLLIWAAKQQTKLNTNFEKLDIHELLQEKLSFFEALANDKQIKLHYQVEPNTNVYADPQQMAFVLRNLIGNAIKFTYKGGQIFINAHKKDDTHWEISVSDTGKGMKAKEIDLVFNEKQHFSTSGTAKEKGTGIGLPLCKEFIENHGTSLNISSKEGQGSRFYFTLKVHN